MQCVHVLTCWLSTRCLLDAGTLFGQVGDLAVWLENVPPLLKALVVSVTYESSSILPHMQYRLLKSYGILPQIICIVVRVGVVTRWG